LAGYVVVVAVHSFFFVSCRQSLRKSATAFPVFAHCAIDEAIVITDVLQDF